MTENAILHIPESQFCFAVNGNTVRLRLRIDRSDAPADISVVYGGKYTFARERHTAAMHRLCEDRLYAYYTATLELSDVRLAYVFKITCADGTFYYSEDGLTPDYDFELSYYNCFQYAYVNARDVMPAIKWLDTACFYQIFVDRFDIGDTQKNGEYINLRWGDPPTAKSFAGGDLKGITQRLKYLKDLGINALYLTPIFKSKSNHKYDISDYYAVDGQFGSKDDLHELVESAHALGMRVVLDAVFNHCSSSFRRFRDVLARGKQSRYYDWFIITDDEPLRYETFASCDYMPKFNTSNPHAAKYLINVATYWIKKFDIDGWRLDVSDEVSHGFWRDLRRAVKAVKPDCALIGENWHDARAFLCGDQFDSVMNYAFTKACLDLYAFRSADAQATADRLNGLLMRNTDTVDRMMLNLLDTHDTHRFLTQVNGDVNKLMSALALTYFYTGVPCIYYGTENAMQGGYDPDCRRTFDWSLAQTDNPVKSLIKTLTALKRTDGFLPVSHGQPTVRIYAENGLLHVQRSKYLLTVNESGGDVEYSCGGKVVCSNLCDGKTLGAGGFIVCSV